MTELISHDQVENPLDLAVVANEALADLTARHEVARKAAILYAIRALVAGTSVDTVMEAIGVENTKAEQPVTEDDDPFGLGMGSLFGMRRQPEPREAFIHHVTTEFHTLLREDGFA